MRRFLIVVLALASSSAFATTKTWEVDPAHTSVTFGIKHMMVSEVHGSFSNVTGTVTTDSKDFKRSNAAISIDATTINTNNAKRDGHLKSADFFDVVKYPSITFKSTSIKPMGKGRFRVTGELTLHGVTKPVNVDVTLTEPVKDFMPGAFRRGFEATATIKRSQFGLVWNQKLEAGGVLVGEDAHVEIDGELVNKPAEATAASPTVKAELKGDAGTR